MSAEPSVTLLELATVYADLLACAEVQREALAALNGRVVCVGTRALRLGRNALLDELDAVAERARRTLTDLESVLLDMEPLQ